MPRFEVQDGKGNVYEVEAPDETLAARAIDSVEAGVRGMLPGQTPTIPGDWMTPAQRERSTAATQFFKGIPVLGAYAEPAGAAISAAAHPVTGAGYPGETFGERYGKNLKTERDAAWAYEAAHPWMSGGLQLAGGAAGTAPLLMMPGGATLMGAAGPIAARMILGANSAGALGTADALARGNSPTTGAWVGELIGGLSPIAGRLAGAGANRVAEALTRVPDELKGLTRGARTALTETAAPDTAARLAQLGPKGFMFEGNPATFNLAQGMVAARPGPAQSRIITAVGERDKGANARLRGDVEANFGPYAEPGTLRARIREEREQIAKGYAAASRNQQSIDVKPILRRLDEEIATEAGATQKALKEARGYFMGPGREMSPVAQQAFDPAVSKSSPAAQKAKSDVYELHRVRMALDDLYNKLGETPVAQGRISKLRQELDSLMPPEVKRVDSAMSEAFKREEALDIGSGKILRSGPEAMTPKGLETMEMSGGPGGGSVTPGQAQMIQAGTRADVERMIGTTANDVAALRKLVGGDGDWNRAKLAQIFGKDKADRVIAAVDREAAFKEAVNKLRDNSQTAQRAQAAKYVEGQVGPDAPTRSDLTVLGAAAAALQKGWGALRDDFSQAARVRADEGLSKALTTQGPERDRVVSALADYKARREQTGVAGPIADRIATILAFNEALQLPRQARANRR